MCSGECFKVIEAFQYFMSSLCRSESNHIFSTMEISYKGKQTKQS